MPKSKRERLTAFLSVEILVEGLSETNSLRRLPFSPALVTRVVRSLRDAKVIDKVRHGKYAFSDDFLRSVSADVLPRMRRKGVTQHPVMTVFEICRMGEWSDQEFELFLLSLKNHRSTLQMMKKI